MTLPSNDEAFDIKGKILRKKNISPEYLKLAIQEDGKEKSTTVYIPRKDESVSCTPSNINFFYRDAIIHVQGCVNSESYYHVTQCSLIKCATNIKMIKEILALSNHLTLASTMSMTSEELQHLIEENSSQKIIVNTIVEKLTGKRAKEPPRYRPGRVKRSDMEILECKEEEGRINNNDDSNIESWRLCQPCQSLNDTIISFDQRRKESVVNLPHGSADLVSAHGKLTRSEYLETKKNNQTTWFIERIQQFDKNPTTFLDVGGGRGDLAVQIAINFPNVNVVVVDSNENSVLAGREYAAKCNVDDRIEFCCINFAQYIEAYESGGQNRVDFVVALHACGDLSDMALSFANSNKCNFVICPCCYPKRYLAPFTPHWHGLCKENEVDSLSRLVELDDHREVSRRAMLVVNSMRKSAFANKVAPNKQGVGGVAQQNVKLEEFDSKISKRNIALVGEGFLSE